MHEIIIAALGPGAKELLTVGSREAMERAKCLVLRTGRHPVAEWLSQNGISYDTLDALHEACEDFDQLIECAARDILARAERAPVCYAVADPTCDETAQRLLSLAPARVLPGVTYAAQLLAACPQKRPVRVCEASALTVAGADEPLCCVELSGKQLAGACKLSLLAWYAPEHPVFFFPPSQKAAREYAVIPLCELDRQKRYDHTAAFLVAPPALERKQRFDFQDLVRVIAYLRGDNGCPWDKKQTHQSLRQYLIEEAYETAAAIDSEDWEHVADELGDVLLQVVLHADIGAQYETFTLGDITTAICRKMISRHPHVFADAHADTAEEVLANWDKLKQKERGMQTQGALMRDTEKGLPALMRAVKVQKNARRVGFDFASPLDALSKVSEEASEVQAELAAARDPAKELGDLFFACVNVARLCDVEPELALVAATEKFIGRFSRMENAIKTDGKSLEDLTISEMDVYWERVKSLEA